MKLDLSLPIRLTGLIAGAKLDLVQAAASGSAPISIVLRTVEPVDQLSGSFPPTISVWGILRKLEHDARLAGGSNVNITERCAPSPGAGSGRLLYQMPAVRVANKELAGFDELQKTLQDLGCSGRELLVLRFLPTEVPYEAALMEIAGFSDKAAELAPPLPERPKTAEPPPEGGDALMADGPEPSQTTGTDQSVSPPLSDGPAVLEPTGEVDGLSAPSVPPNPAALVEPKIAVFQPSSSTTPAAASFDVPDSAYNIGIAELKKIKENYHTAAQPQRLLSDREIAEKEAALRQEMEKINLVGFLLLSVYCFLRSLLMPAAGFVGASEGQVP